MGNQVNMVRPDGSLVQVDADLAGRLGVLGYKEEGQDERDARNVEEGRSNYYSTTGQKVMTFGEGAASALTLGGSDYLFGDDDTEARAKYNPGTRMGGEILGALVPLAMGDGAGLVGLGEEAATGGRLARAAEGVGDVSRTVLGNTPASLLTKGTQALVGEGGGMLKAAVRTGVEGGVYGGANAADHAWLNGDPLTAEAVLHGVGFGSIFGAGLGAAGAGIEAAGTNAAEKLANISKASEESAAAIRAAGEEASSKIIREAETAKQVVATRETAFSNLHGEVRNLNTSVKTSVEQADSVVEAGLEKIKAGDHPMLREAEAAGRYNQIADATDQLGSSYKKAAKAVLGGNPEQAEKAIVTYQESMKELGAHLGVAADNSSVATLQELSTMRAVQKELQTFPKSYTEFSKLTPSRAEKVFATLEQAKGLKDFPALGDAVNSAAEKFTTAVGIENNGVHGLRDAWKAIKGEPAAARAAAKEQGVAAKAAKARSEAEAKAAKVAPEAHEKAGLLRKAVGWAVGGKAASVVSKATGSHLAGWGAFSAVKSAIGAGSLSSGLLGTVGSTLGKVRAAAAAYAPAAGRALQAVAPRVEPLAIKLDGTFDNSTKDKKELAQRRVDEIRQAAPGMKDTLYRAVEPLAATQPKLAPALHQTAVQAFNALVQGLPKDPGAVSGLKPLWNPDDTQAAILQRQLAVFHDPVSVAQDMLRSGHFDQISVKAIQDFAPEIYQQLKVSLLERVSEPGVVSKMSYQDQVEMSTILGIPLHSSMAPQFIASQQQIFTQRNEKNATPQVTVPGQSNGGRPPGPAQSKNSTAAQRITEH